MKYKTLVPLIAKNKEGLGWEVQRVPAGVEFESDGVIRNNCIQFSSNGWISYNINTVKKVDQPTEPPPDPDYPPPSDVFMPYQEIKQSFQLEDGSWTPYYTYRLVTEQ